MKFHCPAKVNLALSVGAPLENGMHPIRSWMVQVSFYDDLIVEPVEGPSAYHIDWAPDAPQPSAIDWPLEKDLAVRAHRMIQQHVGRDLPVRMTLAKRIPVGAGLAGGSSNGAIMLRAINRVHDLGLPHDLLCDMAGQLGSDPAFFLGPASAIVSGLGHVIEPIALDQPIHLVLMLPPLACNTGAVYRTFDAVSPNAALRAVGPGIDPFNDLAEAACEVEPRLRAVRARCGQLLGRAVHVTGSGAAMFALAAGAEEAASLAARITDIPARAVCTL